MTSPILNLLAENRLIRCSWTGTDEHGRQTACLLAAISPEVAAEHSASACPAKIMPAWLAYLTPWMDDAGSDAAWMGMVRRYADLAGRWQVLTDEDWRRLSYTARRIALDAALPHAGNARDVVMVVHVLLVRVEAGETVLSEEFTAARAAAWAAAAEAARAAWAARAAEAAVWAARAAAWAAAAEAAAVVETARVAAWAATKQHAVDAITTAILDAIEARIVAHETINHSAE